jgi:hypothetical protein
MTAMASIVIYKMVNRVEDRFQGMMEAGMRVADTLDDAGTTPKKILIDTLDGLMSERDASGQPVYVVKYTHTDGKEYELADAGSGPGQYEYVLPDHSTKKLIVHAQQDKESGGNENMHLTAPRDTVSLAQGSYLDKVLQDVGINNPTDDQRRYMFGTIIFRRCR